MIRLKSTHGHTLVELMVGMVILLLVIAGAFSFFIFQSIEGFESFRMKRVEEAVSLTQAVILRDILEAGSGMMDHPYLSIYIGSGATSSDSDTLYVSHSGFLTMEMTPTSLSGAAAEAIRKNTVFMAGQTGYQGFIAYDGSGQFTLRYCPKDLATSSGSRANKRVGAVIGVNSANTVKVADVRYDDSITSCTDEASLQGYESCTFKIDSGVPALANGDWIAPAICYRVINGGLWRNPGGGATANGMPLLGGEEFSRVDQFTVNYQFDDGQEAKTWNGTTHIPTKLKLVRVTIRYSTIGRTGQWSPPRTRTVSVSPRDLVLGGS